MAKKSAKSPKSTHGGKTASAPVTKPKRGRELKRASEYTKTSSKRHAIPSASFRRVARFIIKDLKKDECKGASRISKDALEVLQRQIEKNVEHQVQRARTLMAKVDAKKKRKTLVPRYLEIVDSIRDDDPLFIN